MLEQTSGQATLARHSRPEWDVARIALAALVFLALLAPAFAAQADGIFASSYVSEPVDRSLNPALPVSIISEAEEADEDASAETLHDVAAVAAFVSRAIAPVPTLYGWLPDFPRSCSNACTGPPAS